METQNNKDPYNKMGTKEVITLAYIGACVIYGTIKLGFMAGEALIHALFI